jgi:hypothetical protein
MNREPTHTPADPWQWFSGAIYHLGKSKVVKIWNTTNRTVERWSADKNYTASVTKNPLVMFGIVLEKLMEIGKIDFARSAVEYLSGIVGCRLYCPQAEPDKPTLADELLDDVPAVCGFHASMRADNPNIAEVKENLRKAHDELNQSYEQFIRTVN